MNDRRTRRFKERRSMFPFGQLMLPVIGVVAIGLLVIGIKLFFFPGTRSSVVVAMSGERSEASISKQHIPPLTTASPEENSDIAQPVVTRPKVKTVQTSKPDPVLAVPVTGKDQAAPKVEPTSEKVLTAVTVEKKVAEPDSAKRTKEVSSPAKQDTNSSWGVQVGAFTAKKSANSVLSKVKAQGFKGELNQAQVNGKIFYRVRVPSGNSKESATALAQKLKDKGYPTLVIPLVQ